MVDRKLTELTIVNSSLAEADIVYTVVNPDSSPVSGKTTLTQLRTNLDDRARANHTGTQAAITISDFDAEVSSNSAVALNTNKVTNVSTTLSTGTVNSTSYGITSDGGTNDIILAEADTNTAGVLSSIKFDEIVANTSKITNATHTGDVTGDGALIIGIDKVNDTHIDWGLGSNQVSAVDIVIADSGSIITATEVEGALQENRIALNLNTTHSSSDGKDHSDVVLNNSYRGVGHIPLAQKGSASGVAPLDSNSLIASSYLPPVAITTVAVYVSEVAMLAATTEEGDVGVRSDENKSYMHNSGSAGTMADWTELQTPTDSVLSVNGEVGTVVLTTGDVGVDADSNYVTDTQLTVIGNTSGTNSGDDPADDTAYNATSWDANSDSATKNAIRDKVETMDTAIGLNTAKTTNATHSGEVTGSGALTVDKTAISNKTLVTAVGADHVLIEDATDGNLKKALISDFASAGGDMAASVYDPTTIAGDTFDMDNMVEGTTTKILTATERTAISDNSAKDTNVSTDLSLGTITATTINVNSSDGTNATLVEATTTNAGILGSDKWDEIVANSLKVTNANHSGDATGDTALTLATVNSNVGSFTAADITVNAKGLITAASNGSGGAPEGTAVLSTGEVGGTKFLREDGDGTCSWQAAAGAGTVTSIAEGDGMDFTTITSTGTITMGTPGSLSATSSNNTSLKSHTHSIFTGLIDNRIVQIDSTTVADTEYARFTAVGLESRSNAEVLSDIAAAPIANPTFTGEIGIGAINVDETELGILEGATLTTTELNYVDGVTSSIQTQLGTKLANINEDTTPELGGELDAGAHSIGFTLQTATGDGTTTIDWKLGNKFKFTFGAFNETFTFTAPTNPGSFQLILVQDGTGSRTATWPATVMWAGKTAPTLSTAASSIDVVTMTWDGTNYIAVASLDFGVPA